MFLDSREGLTWSTKVYLEREITIISQDKGFLACVGPDWHEIGYEFSQANCEKY